MKMLAILGVLISMAVMALTTARAEVVLESGVTTCTITTGAYRLNVDASSPEWLRLTGPAGEPLMTGAGEVAFMLDGKRYTSAGRPAPHLHALRAGPYLVELALENVTLAAGDAVWPGLAELRLACHEDLVFVHLRLLLPSGDWINAGRFVYRRPQGHPMAADCLPTSAGLQLQLGESAPVQNGPGWLVGGTPALGVQASLPATTDTLTRQAKGLWLAVPTGGATWTVGSAHEAAAVLAVGAAREAVMDSLATAADPLPLSAFQTTKGQALGYDPRNGLYGFKAETSPTPDPPRGARGGSYFTVTNNARTRTILVDSWDPWGGICAGMVRDDAGQPQPVLVQFGLNFPELNSQAGEPGWATLTFPLTLAAGEPRTLRVEHDYGSATDRELMDVNSLENIGDPLLLQTTVGKGESHTLTTGPYPGALTPGNELRINDFRRIYSQIVVRSVSAVLPTFFGYYNAAGQYQGLMPGQAHFRETGPFLIEYTVAARTPDGSVSGELRTWQAPHADMTRVFTEVTLHVDRDVALAASRPAPLFFLRHHSFNPMAYSRYACQGAQGVTTGVLNFSPHVVLNGAPLGRLPFGALYRAENGMDNGLPCSDISGNPGWVLLDWDVKFGDKAVQPGVYVFTTGANDSENGDYSRDMAVVPAERVTTIPAGSTIHYRAMHLVAGKNDDDQRLFAAEREAWALHPLTVQAATGRVVSVDPPEVAASGGKAVLTLSGGKDWVPVRVSGLQAGQAVKGWIKSAAGEQELVGGSAPEAWYGAWPQDRSRMGVTFLVRMPASGEAVEVRIEQPQYSTAAAANLSLP